MYARDRKLQCARFDVGAPLRTTIDQSVTFPDDNSLVAASHNPWLTPDEQLEYAT